MFELYHNKEGLLFLYRKLYKMNILYNSGQGYSNITYKQYKNNSRLIIEIQSAVC